MGNPARQLDSPAVEEDGRQVRNRHYDHDRPRAVEGYAERGA
jgi:hypothetical protein